MGNMIVALQDVRIAGVPTFIPGATVNEHKCLITVLNNRTRKNGDKILDEVGLTFWGKYAQVAAQHLEKGRAINVIGELRSYKYETGRTKPNGSPEIQRDNSINVQSFTFSNESAKALAARINVNLAKAKEEGRLDPNTNITGEELIAIEPRKMVGDYSPELTSATGMYGNARIWIKGSGFITPSNTNISESIEAMEKRPEQMKAAMAKPKESVNTDSATAPDPFKAAQPQ